MQLSITNSVEPRLELKRTGMSEEPVPVTCLNVKCVVFNHPGTWKINLFVLAADWNVVPFIVRVPPIPNELTPS